MMLLLDPTPFACGLARKKVDVVNYPDGRFTVQFEGTPLPFRVFDKIQTVRRERVLRVPIERTRCTLHVPCKGRNRMSRLTFWGTNSGHGWSEALGTTNCSVASPPHWREPRRGAERDGVGHRPDRGGTCVSEINGGGCWCMSRLASWAPRDARCHQVARARSCQCLLPHPFADLGRAGGAVSTIRGASRW